MLYYTHKQLFYVDSHNKIDGTDDSFSYQFDIDNDIDYDAVVMLDCSIPKSNYVVQSSNNTFTCVLNTGSGDVNFIVNMPIGNYNRNSFRNVLKTLLNTNADTYIFDITFDNPNRTQDNGKYTFTWTNANPSAQEPKFIFTTGLYEQMGFNKNTTYIFSSGSLESVNVINMRPEATMYILSNICQNRNNNIFQNVISSGSSDYDYIIFHNTAPAEYSKDFTKTKSNIFKFTITDEDFNPINLNGLNVVFTIMVYKRNNINRLLEGFIKLKTLNNN